ncbi:MAG: hypothetical protein PHS54_07375 [Clostridia bacterium]|nr:hypothetical protein [Clostridia bacterium]
MATSKKEAISPSILKQQKELVALMLKKAGIKYEELVDASVRLWVAENLDLLSPSEREKYKSVIL